MFELSDLLAALALVLIIEGLFPFASPSGAQKLYQSLAVASPTLLRRVGLASIGVGLLLLYLVRL